MIYDSLTHIGQYTGITARLDQAIASIQQTDLASLAPGRYEVDGDDVYFMVQTPDLKKREETKWEIHRRYIDIQIGLQSGEAIGYLPVDAVQGWQAYNEEKDVSNSFTDSPDILLPLNMGMFAVLFPHDAHRPCEAVGDIATGLKVVYKVRVD